MRNSTVEEPDLLLSSLKTKLLLKMQSQLCIERRSKVDTSSSLIKMTSLCKKFAISSNQLRNKTEVNLKRSENRGYLGNNNENLGDWEWAIEDTWDERGGNLSN